MKKKITINPNNFNIGGILQENKIDPLLFINDFRPVETAKQTIQIEDVLNNKIHPLVSLMNMMKKDKK